MNEPLKSVSVNVRTIDGKQFRSWAATDRLGFRQVVHGSQALPDGEALMEKMVQQKRLVLVEDSDDDAHLFSMAVRRSGRSVCVSRAASIEQGRSLLADPMPSLIALDCHLPGGSGLDLLREVRAREVFRRVPVVMMSGTECDDDVQSAYALGANSFLRKPWSCDEYMDSVKLLLEYWLDKNCTSLSPWTAPSGMFLG